MALLPKRSYLMLSLSMLLLAGLGACRIDKDDDGDGYNSEVDCNDGSDSIHPHATETCDGVDQDCDGEVDETLPHTSFYPDADEDRFGEAGSAPLVSCDTPAGMVTNQDDCNDEDAAIRPDADETCDGIDQDCDGQADEDVTLPTYPDEDGDGYGEAGSAPVASCDVSPGMALNQSDCNDADASIHPAAVETCDGLDRDCDGRDMIPELYYTDADGDGYGDELLGASCHQTETSTTQGGDCDDSEVTTYPGAFDVAGDGVDSSCDGTDGLAPSVGLPTSTFTTLQAALDAALDGQTVWVGPGTYNEFGLSMKGKSLRLASTAGEGNTYIDGQQLGTLFYFNTGETETSSLEGFTIQNGKASCNTSSGSIPCHLSGGGIFMDGTSPALRHLRFLQNAGGGIYMQDASPTLEHVTFLENSDGGISMDSSTPTLTHIAFTRNSAYDGGGMRISLSSPMLAHVTFKENTASEGGGMYLSGGASPTLTHVTLEGNTADIGGGMSLDLGSSPTLTHVNFTGNTATRRGGGMDVGLNSSPKLRHVVFAENSAPLGGGVLVYSSAPTLTHVTFKGNTASTSGGGMYLDYSAPTLTNVTFTGNTADEGGGGIALEDSSPTLNNVILAYNRATFAGNFYNRASSAATASCSLIYNPSGWGTDNVTVTGTYLTVEPQFLDYADSSSGASCTPGSSTTCLPADLHPALGSPLIDAGDPAMSDVDGSRADIGSYGGQFGDRWDVDGDGAPDYFWPGEWDDAPSGFDPADYDCDDLDPDVQGC